VFGGFELRTSSSGSFGNHAVERFTGIIVSDLNRRLCVRHTVIPVLSISPQEASLLVTAIHGKLRPLLSEQKSWAENTHHEESG
jgi:hypothetical protein